MFPILGVWGKVMSKRVRQVNEWTSEQAACKETE